MKRLSTACAAAALLLTAGAALPVRADAARDAILTAYAADAQREDSGFTGFDAARGRALYMGPHTGGKAETPACATCHTPDPTRSGQHQKTGRSIDPMAVSANPARFTNAADVEKRFSRDCPAVLGRACTAREKGDFITYLTGKP